MKCARYGSVIPLEWIHAPKQTSIFASTGKMLSRHYPEQEIIRTMQDMGLAKTTAKKIILLSKTPVVLDVCRESADSATAGNAEEKLAEIEEKLSSSIQYSDIAQKLSEISGKEEAKKAVDEKQVSFSEMVEIVKGLFGEGNKEFEVKAMFSELGIGEASAEAIMQEAKKQLSKNHVVRPGAEPLPAHQARETSSFPSSPSVSSNDFRLVNRALERARKARQEKPAEPIDAKENEVKVGESTPSPATHEPKQKSGQVRGEQVRGEQVQEDGLAGKKKKTVFSGLKPELEKMLLEKPFVQPRTEPKPVESPKNQGREGSGLGFSGTHNENEQGVGEAKQDERVGSAMRTAHAEKIEKKLSDMQENLKKELQLLASMASQHDTKFAESMNALTNEFSQVKNQIEKYKRTASKNQKLSSKINRLEDLHEKLEKLKSHPLHEPKQKPLFERITFTKKGPLEKKKGEDKYSGS